jgi:hypothetical protein
MWPQWLSLSLPHNCPLKSLRERSYYQNLGQKMPLLTLAWLVNGERAVDGMKIASHREVGAKSRREEASLTVQDAFRGVICWGQK